MASLRVVWADTSTVIVTYFVCRSGLSAYSHQTPFIDSRLTGLFSALWIGGSRPNNEWEKQLFGYSLVTNHRCSSAAALKASFINGVKLFSSKLSERQQPAWVLPQPLRNQTFTERVVIFGLRTRRGEARI